MKFAGRKWMKQENIASSFSYSDLSFSVSYVHFFLGVREGEDARKRKQGPRERKELLSVDNCITIQLQ